FEGILGVVARFDDEFFDRINGVAGFTVLVDFLTGAVFRGVGHGMAAITVGLDFQQGRAFAGAGVCHGAFARFMDGENIHAVHLVGGDAESLAALVELGIGAGAGGGGAHGVFVVLKDEYHGKLPQG